MLDFDDETKKRYTRQILEALDTYSYRYKRYNIHFAVALCYCKKDLVLGELETFKRKTDTFLSLEENLASLVFDCIDHNASLQTSQKLENWLEEKCAEGESFMRVFCTLEYESASKVVDALFDAFNAFFYELKLQEI